MNRDSILEDVLGIESNAILLEMGTGSGKTRLAIEKAASRNCKKILVVGPKHPVLKGWETEFCTWGYEELLSSTSMCCYNSLAKYTEECWDMIIFDEAHHLSERCRDIYALMNTKNVMFLSATMKRDIMYFLNKVHPNLYIYRIGTRTTIEEGILADPEVYLIPLSLDTKKPCCEIIKNPKGKTPAVVCLFNDRWKYLKQKEKKVIIKCSQREYYYDLTMQIEYFKRKGMFSEAMQSKHLKLAGDRLKWLARQKNQVVKSLLDKLGKERTLTFCCDIEQSEVFGPNSVNSKSKQSIKILEDFNRGHINHIQACNMLDEGVNLVNCRVGIFANINASERIIVQRNGRILRHKKPVIILPYYVGTREEELVKEMMVNYNSELIKKVENLLDFKLL